MKKIEMFVARVDEYIGVGAPVYYVDLGISCSMAVTVHRNGGQDLPLFSFTPSSFHP